MQICLVGSISQTLKTQNCPALQLDSFTAARLLGAYVCVTAVTTVTAKTIETVFKNIVTAVTVVTRI